MLSCINAIMRVMTKQRKPALKTTPALYHCNSIKGTLYQWSFDVTFQEAEVLWSTMRCSNSYWVQNAGCNLQTKHERNKTVLRKSTTAVPLTIWQLIGFTWFHRSTCPPNPPMVTRHKGSKGHPHIARWPVTASIQCTNIICLPLNLLDWKSREPIA